MMPLNDAIQAENENAMIKKETPTPSLDDSQTEVLIKCLLILKYRNSRLPKQD